MKQGGQIILEQIGLRDLTETRFITSLPAFTHSVWKHSESESKPNLVIDQIFLTTSPTPVAMLEFEGGIKSPNLASHSFALAGDNSIACRERRKEETLNEGKMRNRVQGCKVSEQENGIRERRCGQKEIVQKSLVHAFARVMYGPPYPRPFYPRYL